MIKQVHSHLSVHKTSHSGKTEIVVAFSLFIGSLSLLIDSYLSHEVGNALCRCILCTIERLPEEGEYTYNAYLLLISIAWGALVLGILSILHYRCQKRKHR